MIQFFSIRHTVLFFIEEKSTLLESVKDVEQIFINQLK